MNTLKALVLIVLGWVSASTSSFAATSSWDGVIGVMPEEIGPPWTRVSSGNTAAYRDGDGGSTVAYLISTQAVDTIFYEQSGARIQMTNQLVIDAVVRIVDGVSTATNRGLAGITFTTAPNVGGSLWFGVDTLFVTAAGDVRGGSTNIDTDGGHRGYHIAVSGTNSGSSYTVYYDGTLVLTGALYTSAASFGPEPRIQWGEISTSAYGESHWRSFVHNAATPLDVITNPAVQFACTNLSSIPVPTVSGPFLNLVSEGRITNGTSFHYANYSLLFDTDSGKILEAVQGGYSVLDSGPRRIFTQSDGSEIMLFEFTDLTFAGIGVGVRGSRAAAILATGDIQILNTRIIVEAAGDAGPLGAAALAAGTNAPAPLGGGGGRGIASAYNAGEPPYLTFGKLPISGAGGGGFVSPGQAGYQAEPVRMWRYDGPPTYTFTLLGTFFRPGGEGGSTYTNFSVLRGGGAGGSTSGTGFAGNSGFNGGHGGGALFLSTPTHIYINSRSSISVDGQTMVSYLSEIAAGGAGGYLVLNGGRGILNQGGLSARGGGGRKALVGTPFHASWGSSGDGGGGLIVLKSAAGVTNSGSLLFNGGSGEICTLGALQAQTPSFVNLPPRLVDLVSSNSQFSFSFIASTNQTYDVQRNDDLNTTNWVTFTNIIGAGVPVSILSPTPGVPKRFFRVRAR